MGFVLMACFESASLKANPALRVERLLRVRSRISREQRAARSGGSGGLRARGELPRGARGSHWLRSSLVANNPYPRGEEAVFTGPKGGRASQLRLLPPPADVLHASEHTVSLFLLTQFEIMPHNFTSHARDCVFICR